MYRESENNIELEKKIFELKAELKNEQEKAEILLKMLEPRRLTLWSGHLISLPQTYTDPLLCSILHTLSHTCFPVSFGEKQKHPGWIADP